MVPLSRLMLPRARKLTGSLFLTRWKSCFWTVMGTEGIPKGLETPARSLSAPWLLGACLAPVLHLPEGLGLSLAQGEVGRG